MTADIIASIDRAIGCQRCGNPLGSSPSDDFCGERCQHAWHAKRAPRVAPANSTGNRVSISVNASLAPDFAERVAEATGSICALARLLWEVENQTEEEGSE